MLIHAEHPKARTVIAFLIVSLSAACATESNIRPNDAPGVSNPSVMWEDGAKAVDTGEAMLTSGEKRLELGRRQVREGEAKIRSGSEGSEKAKLEYEQAAADSSATAAQKNALRAIGLRWEQAIQEIRDGNKLVATGKANIDRGESEVREGRLLMETGSVLMRNAHRSRLGQTLLPMPAG